MILLTYTFAQLLQDLVLVSTLLRDEPIYPVVLSFDMYGCVYGHLGLGEIFTVILSLEPLSFSVVVISHVVFSN